MKSGITLHRVYLSLGSNLGNRLEYLKKAVSSTEEHIGEVRLKSSVYETEPWKMENSNNFYNAVIEVYTALSPFDLLDAIGSIENSAGRNKSFSGEYLSRTLDIDILFYDDLVLTMEHLIIPHPHIASRNFVLVPLYEIAPDLINPANGIRLADLYKECQDKSRVTKLKPL